MRRYRGHQSVEPGFYFNPRRLSFASVEGEGSLPGTEQEEYLRVPALAMLVMGPLLGLAYVIFLPLAGFVMLAWIAGSWVVALAGRAAAACVSVLKPAWRPTMAFFSRGKAAKRESSRPDAWAEEVKKELERPDDDGR
jgi:hypothetical protein